MSNAHTNDTGPSLRQFLPEPSLDALALAEALDEMRARGGLPRLGELIAALPDAAGELVDALLAHSAEIAESDDTLASDAQAQLSPGTLRGLQSIFGVEDVSLADYRPPAERDDGQDSAPAMVAEASAQYDVAPGETVGLLALAHQQGFDTETLAAQVLLSPEALVFHLTGALGVERERIRQALASGETATETPDFPGMLSATDSLTPAQRNYWVALLSSSG